MRLAALLCSLATALARGRRAAPPPPPPPPSALESVLAAPESFARPEATLYALLAFSGSDAYWAVVGTVIAEQFGYGFGFAAFLMFLIYIAEGASKTSHYAIATGFMALGMMVPGMISGYVQEWLGYPGFFVWVVAAAVPAFLLLPRLSYPARFGRKTDTAP